MVAQNCKGEDNILSPVDIADGDGEVHKGEARLVSSSKGDIMGGTGISHNGESWPIGEVGEEGLELDIRGETGCKVLGGVAIKGASRGGKGGPTSCRILLRVSAEQSIGVEVSALARMV